VSDAPLPRAARRGHEALETGVLAVLRRARKPLTVDVVRGRLGGAESQTAVRTILTRLYTQGAVERVEQAGAVGYTLCTAGPIQAALRMTRALASEHDHADTLAVFLDALTEQDRRTLRGLICPPC
jgi:predicted transcriptional regulator